MIIEAEEAAAPLEDASAVQQKISAALKNAQLTEVAAQLLPDDDGYEMLIILKEGYVMVRVWEELEYCAFDVLLWSSTSKMDATKAQLVAAVESKSVSSYRILTSGMFGVSSSDDDDKTSLVGPRIKEPCKQEPAKKNEKKDDDVQVKQSVIDSVLSESIKLLPDPNALVVVLCGEKSSPCNSVGVLESMNDEVIAKVVPLWACPNVNDASPDVMMACEASASLTLQNLDTPIDGLVIDVEAPRAMGQILLKILTNNYSVQGSSLLSENHVLISTFATPSEQEESTIPWRRALVDRFRTDIVKYDPAYRAQVLVSDGNDDGKLELNLFSSGDEHFYMHLVDTIKSIPTTTEVQMVQNGINNYIADFEPSMRFRHADYDDTASMKQWESQEPLEVQTVYQFVLSTESTTIETLQDTLTQALIKLNGHEEEDTLVYDKTVLQSDGCVLFSHWPMGSMMVVWDGRSRISINLFSSQDSIPRLEKHLTNKMNWKLIARDEMPRGIGKVVNFSDEALHIVPHWAQERPPDV
jgi:S-adenosylmethionine/arginine decarboxylase-like enzyme